MNPEEIIQKELNLKGEISEKHHAMTVTIKDAIRCIKIAQLGAKNINEMNTDNAKKYLDGFQINDRSIWDSQDNEHPLECLLEEYHQAKLKNIVVLDHVRLSLMREVWDKWTSGDNVEFDEWLHKEINEA